MAGSRRYVEYFSTSIVLSEAAGICLMDRAPILGRTTVPCSSTWKSPERSGSRQMRRRTTSPGSRTPVGVAEEEAGGAAGAPDCARSGDTLTKPLKTSISRNTYMMDRSAFLHESSGQEQRPEGRA